MRAAPPSRRAGHQGSALLDVLVALVIFSLGVMGLVAAQGATIKNASQSGYRAIAAAMAEDLIDQMWLSDRSLTSLQSNFSSSTAGASYSAWQARVANSGLPGVAAHAPEVSVTSVVGSSTLVVVVVHWQAPSETSPHSYTAVAQIK